MSEQNYFEQLFTVNVSDKIEKKNGLSYVSWSYAWGELKKLHPDATYTVYENEAGWMYHTDGHTCWVKVGVTVDGIEHIEYLPIMDFKNKSIPLEQVTSMDANKAVQRALTKAIARHGLGLYVYAGEDLPELSAEEKAEQEELKKKITPKEATVLAGILNDAQVTWVFNTYRVKSLEELTNEQYGKLMHTLRERAEHGA